MQICKSNFTTPQWVSPQSLMSLSYKYQTKGQILPLGQVGTILFWSKWTL